MRDHSPATITNFKGLWQRGDPENVPLDHFENCDNLKFVGDNITVRDGIGVSQDVAVPLEDIVRMYNYPTTEGNTLLVLTYDGTTGNIYHVENATTTFLILTITGMSDFAFVPYAGRAYISPFGTFDTGDLNIQKGLDNEFLYVYNGDGVAARKAAGATPAGTLTVANGAVGNTDAGMHVFGVVGETDTGYLSSPVALMNFVTTGNRSVSFTGIPIFSGSQWTKRHIVASIVIPSYNGNREQYQLFFLPNGTINDNVTTTLSNISFFDADLLEDASHLFDNYDEIPAGAALWIYHDRLCLGATFDDISIVIISAPGEPEAISEIDGLLIVPPDGNPVTNGAELRDVMYVFKRAKTWPYIDNGEEPSSWEAGTPVDNALGCPVHGIATQLDSGSNTVDYLIVATFAGIYIFNGRYQLPELSWKVSGLWKDLDRNEFRKIQIVLATVQKWLLVVLPDGRILCGDYTNGLDSKNIRWLPWSFDANINCIAIVNIDEIHIGADV